MVPASHPLAWVRQVAQRAGSGRSEQRHSQERAEPGKLFFFFFFKVTQGKATLGKETPSWDFSI